MRLRLMKRTRNVKEPRVRQPNERVIAARQERVRSERRLAEVTPLKTIVHAMHERNHVGDYLDALIEKRTREGGAANDADTTAN